MTAFIKETFNLGLLRLKPRGLVHCCYGGKPGCLQADMVLEKELKKSSTSGSAGSRK